MDSESHNEHPARWRNVAGSALVRLIVYVAAVVLVVVAATIVTRLVVPPPPSLWHQWVLIKNLLLPIIELALYAALVRRFEHRPAREIDLRQGGLRFLGLGALCGALIIGTTILILWGLGQAAISRGTGAQGLVNELLVPFTTSVVEEILFRAILFRLVEEMTGTSVAALLSAVLFGLAHVGNPASTGLTIAMLGLGLGLLLAIAYASTRSLWMPIGIHMGWNFTLGYGFGAPNSGLLDPHALFHTSFTGSALLTGGASGPEASILTLVLTLGPSAALAVRAHRGGRWQPLRFRSGPTAP